jgi:hypothetical protein
MPCGDWGFWVCALAANTPNCHLRPWDYSLDELVVWHIAVLEVKTIVLLFHAIKGRTRKFDVS